MSSATDTRGDVPARHAADPGDRDGGGQYLGSGGRTEWGTITIGDGVVAKIAARAAREIPDAGAAAPRLLSRTLGSTGVPGVRKTSLDALPKTTADVDGSMVHLALQLSVRWPASIPQVTNAVREHVSERVERLTSLRVMDVDIEVTDLVTSIAPPARVH